MENYLQEKHAENYMGLDDDMPDAFDAWMLDLEVDEWIEYADEYAVQSAVDKLMEYHKEEMSLYIQSVAPELCKGTQEALSKKLK